MRIAWLGTGLMGRPMAERMLAAGHEVTVWNRTRAKTAPLAALGARVADEASDAIASAETVFTMLRDGATTEAALLDGDAFLSKNSGHLFNSH